MRVSNQTLFNQFGTSSKEYSVTVINTPGTRRKVFNVIGTYGKIGRAHAVRTLGQEVAADEAVDIREEKIDDLLSAGYGFELNKKRLGKSLTAFVAGPKARQSNLSAASAVAPMPKVVEGRLPKNVEGRLPRKATDTTGAIKSLKLLEDFLLEKLAIGDRVNAKIIECTECHAKNEDCQFCEGSGQQVALSNIPGEEKSIVTVRTCNVKFD